MGAPDEKQMGEGSAPATAGRAGQAIGSATNAGERTAPYPVKLEVEYPAEFSRLWALGTLLFLVPKMIVLIPHLIILYVLNIIFLFVFILGQLIVLFTGKFPRGLFDFAVGYYRWTTRVSAFTIGLTDKYPPFRMKEAGD